MHLGARYVFATIREHDPAPGVELISHLKLQLKLVLWGRSQKHLENQVLMHYWL